MAQIIPICHASLGQHNTARHSHRPGCRQHSALFARRVVNLLPKLCVECDVAALGMPRALVEHLAMVERGNVEVQGDCWVGMGRVLHAVQADLV